MKNILVVGSLNMDLVLQMEKIPSVGETVLGDGLRYSLGGKGANQAFAAGNLGGNVEMLGCVGEDSFGAKLVRNLASVGVDVGHIGRSASPGTGTAVICVEKSGDNSIVVVPGANKTCDEEYLRSNDAAFQKCDYILLQMEIPRDAVEYAVNRGKELSKTIILNPAPAPAALPQDILSKVDYIIPNETELSRLSGCRSDSENEMEAAARKLIAAGAHAVIVTLGHKGSVLVQKDTLERFPPIQVEAVDTTAAGDCFCAAFAVALADGKTPAQAISFANVAAGLAVTRPGAQDSIPTQAEVEERRVSERGRKEAVRAEG
ncbi:MAG: ribokinase [Synergistaceae bacterium]|jgi:ribokinase|nr:ribokinase [Synergistaceae bacterium]